MKASLRKAVFFALMGAGAAALSAVEASRFFDAGTYRNLQRERFLQTTYYHPERVDLQLVPHTDLSRFTTSFWPEEEGAPVYTAESLYLLSKKDLNAQNPQSVTLEEVSRIFRSVNSMEGIPYFSHKENRWTSLYKHAYCVAGENSKTRIPDDTAGSADGKVMYCMQDDNSFGKMYYKLSYHQNDYEICANFVTTSAVYIGPIKAISPGNLRISLMSLDCGDDILVYLLVQSKFPSMTMLENRMNESFVARLDAIYSWFVAQF